MQEDRVGGIGCTGFVNGGWIVLIGCTLPGICLALRLNYAPIVYIYYFLDIYVYRPVEFREKRSVLLAADGSCLSHCVRRKQGFRDTGGRSRPG
jgi:hypothetical protein